VRLPGAIAVLPHQNEAHVLIDVEREFNAAVVGDGFLDADGLIARGQTHARQLVARAVHDHGLAHHLVAEQIAEVMPSVPGRERHQGEEEQLLHRLHLRVVPAGILPTTRSS
jgi:hypothetical protein